MKRWLLCFGALAATGLAIWLCVHLQPVQEHLPGADAVQRRLLRIWLVSSPGGGESWLRTCLRTWEKQNPGVMTFLRTVTADEVTREDAVLPDLVLYTPGAFTAPQDLFAPLSSITGVREELLRSGRWQGQQYGLPLCYAGYALAIDSALEPALAQSPAPTTLLGRPAATFSAQATATPGLPDSAQLLSCEGCGLFTLGTMLAERPALAESPLPSSEIFRRFQARQAQAAMLTTGQITALSGIFPFRVMTPAEVITDQLLLASVLPHADDTASRLLSWLISAEGQRRLSAQGLHTVRDDLRLYVSGTDALVETAAARALTAINAYTSAADVSAAAWQYWCGRTGLSQALAPLL